MLHAATIVGAYGIKGWVKLRSYTDPIDNVLTYSRWCVNGPSGLTEVSLLEGRRQGKGLIAQIEGVNDRTAAEALRDTKLWVPARELPILDEGDFYWHELVGLRVWSAFDGETKLLGAVSHLLETGANDVMVVAPCEGSLDERERLVPYTPDKVVAGVDKEAGRIDVVWHPED